MSLRKVSTQRKFVGENNSSRKFSRPYQTSLSSEPLNFTRRSDLRRPWSWANRRTNQQHQGRAGPQATSPFNVATSELPNTSASKPFRLVLVYVCLHVTGESLL